MKITDVNVKIKSSNPTEPRTLRTKAGVFELDMLGKVAGSVEMRGTKRVEIEADGEGDLNSKRGDVWYYVEDVPLVGKTGLHDGYMAMIHSGKVLCTVTGEEPIPNPNPSPSPVDDDVAVIVDTKLKTVTIHSDVPEMAVYFNGVKLR